MDKTEELEATFSAADIKKTHDLYKENIDDWLFHKVTYQGGDDFIDEVLFQHTREEDDAFTQRKLEAYSFNYASSIIHLLNFFLTDTPPLRDPGPLAYRDDWKRFIDNVDLYGSNMDVFLNDNQKLAAIYGSVGLLIDKPGGLHNVDDINTIPYLVTYTLNNILDWKFERSLVTNVYELAFVKLKDDNHDYLVWTREKWQRFILDDDESSILEIHEGKNPLGIVPFIWMPNIRGLQHPYLGISDLNNVGKICGEIVRTLSECSQTLKYAAFPMFRMPLEDAYETDHADEDDNVVVGKEAVLNFNPEYGSGGKPDWLESPIRDSVNGTRDYCDYITEEMYRSSLLSSVLVQRDKAQQKGGTMLRVEQKQLSALLSKKANNLVEAELAIMRIWCMWQSCDDLAESYEITKSRTFSVDELSVEIEYQLAAVAQVPSDEFAKEIFRKIANTLLPNIPITDLKKIEDEIVEYDSSLIDEEAVETETRNMVTKPVELEENKVV